MSEKIETIKKLIKEIDDKPDKLHLDITPSVLALSKLGMEIVPYLEAPLSSESEYTRLHAQRTLELMISYHFGFVTGQGWKDPKGEDKFRELWKKNGSYDFEAPEQDRSNSIKAWMIWYKQSSK